MGQPGGVAESVEATKKRALRNFRDFGQMER